MTRHGRFVTIPPMLNSLRRWFGRPGIAVSRVAAKRACVDALERRTLMSADPVVEAPPITAAADPADTTPPTLINEQLIGTDPRNVDGVILTFSEPLDPATL